MKGLAFWFFALGVLSVLIGMGWGIQMSATQDHGLAPAHAHLNLLGWVGFAIFGVYYHLVPQAAETRLAQAHFVLSVVGLAALVPGIAMALTGQGDVLAKIGSVLSLAAMVTFGLVVVRSRERAPQGRTARA